MILTCKGGGCVAAWELYLMVGGAAITAATRYPSHLHNTALSAGQEAAAHRRVIARQPLLPPLLHLPQLSVLLPGMDGEEEVR